MFGRHTSFDNSPSSNALQAKRDELDTLAGGPFICLQPLKQPDQLQVGLPTQYHAVVDARVEDGLDSSRVLLLFKVDFVELCVELCVCKGLRFWKVHRCLWRSSASECLQSGLQMLANHTELLSACWGQQGRLCRFLSMHRLAQDKCGL